MFDKTQYKWFISNYTWYALTEEELDEIVSCKDQPVLEAYIEVVFKL